MKMLEHWLPPTDAGAPVACLATSFTFDAEFFSAHCLSRFLGIAGRDNEAAPEHDIAGVLEEEERLAQARVAVLVDQSCQPDHRNLRWDLIPIRVPGALLHAKVAVLMWERATRVIIGSANLTKAGYRDQVEIGLALDLTSDCEIPRSVPEDLATELRSILTLAAGSADRAGPVQRAAGIIDSFRRRLDELDLPDAQPKQLRMALAPSGRGRNPLERREAVWSGGPPFFGVALSPFWDESDDMPGAQAFLGGLAKRSTGDERTTALFVVPVDARVGSNVVLAPRRLRTIAPKRIDADVLAFDGDYERRLHAKAIGYMSSTWAAWMVGSSNLTAKGLGLDARPHREINLWIGCKVDSRIAEALADLAPCGASVLNAEQWEANPEDEEAAQEAAFTELPAGFGEALITAGGDLELGFTGKSLPAVWRVTMSPPGSPEHVLLASTSSTQLVGRVVCQRPEGSDWFPSFLEVTWESQAETRRGAWLVNITDPSVLPPPAELRALSMETLLLVLASSRPLRLAIEDALARQSGEGAIADESDPLKRFDSSGMLLQRTRRASAAFAGLERRLNHRLTSMETLEWRLAGTLGPENLARTIVIAAQSDRALDGEAQFLLAELALAVARVPWAAVSVDLALDSVLDRVDQTLNAIRSAAADLAGDRAPARSLAAYVGAAFEQAVTR